MRQEPISPIVLASVRMLTEALSTDDLVAINLGISLHEDPSHAYGYEKIKRLFTEDDGRKMHAETRRAWEYLVSERLKNV